jgi:hypothetical protein
MILHFKGKQDTLFLTNSWKIDNNKSFLKEQY